MDKLPSLEVQTHLDPSRTSADLIASCAGGGRREPLPQVFREVLAPWHRIPRSGASSAYHWRRPYRHHQPRLDR